MSARGFTLVEMMVVVAIVAVVAAIAVPNFSALIEGRKVRAAAEQLRDVLVLARQEALKRNAPVVVASVNNVVTATISEFGANPALGLAEFQTKATVPNKTVTISGSGRASASTTFAISPAKAACKADGGVVTCYSVQVLTGGAVRICDPTLSTEKVGACL